MAPDGGSVEFSAARRYPAGSETIGWIFILSLAAAPFLPATKGKPLPE